MKTHTDILIRWSDENDCYIASLPDFGPYAKTHGDTYAESFKNAQEVLNLMLDETQPLPEPQTYQVTE